MTKIATKSLNFVGPLFRKDCKIMSWKDLKFNFSSSSDHPNVINDGVEFE